MFSSAAALVTLSRNWLGLGLPCVADVKQLEGRTLGTGPGTGQVGRVSECLLNDLMSLEAVSHPWGPW